MMSIRQKLFFLVVILLVVQGVAFAEQPVSLPFDVTLGGQAAVPAGTVAKIDNPVAPDAELEVNLVTTMMIINFFISDENGNVTNANSSASEIIMASTNKVKINQTISKNALKPGIYLANIMANNNTSRIVFKVQ